MGSIRIGNRDRLPPALLSLAALAALRLACGSTATLIPLTPYADYFPNNPIVHQEGRTIVDGNGEPLRLRGSNIGG